MTFHEQAATLDRNGIVELLVSRQQLATRIEELTRQLEWFKRQLFGEKSERRFLDPDSRQLAVPRQNSIRVEIARLTVARSYREW